MIINEIKNRIKAGETAQAIIKEAIESLKSISDYNAILNIPEERALKRAEAVDSGDIQGRLAGVPLLQR